MRAVAICAGHHRLPSPTDRADLNCTRHALQVYAVRLRSRVCWIFLSILDVPGQLMHLQIMSKPLRHSHSPPAYKACRLSLETCML